MLHDRKGNVNKFVICKTIADWYRAIAIAIYYKEPDEELRICDQRRPFFESRGTRFFMPASINMENFETVITHGN